MKEVRIFLLLLFLLGSTILLPGCWNYREIDKLALVAGAAVDRSEDGKQYLLTAEIADFSGGGGREFKIKSKKIQAEGHTLFDAARNAIKISGKKLYWSHANIFIVSQDVAREGLLPVVDYIARGAERRLQNHILVTKGGTAAEHLSQQSTTATIRSFEIDRMVEEERKSLSKSIYMDVRTFINDLAEEGITPTLPLIGDLMNEGQITCELSGAALFRKEKLIGLLNGEETKYVRFVKDQIEGGLLPFKSNSSDIPDGISMEILKSKTTINPVLTNGTLAVNIEVKTEVSLEELGSDVDLIGEKGRESLRKHAEEVLASKISGTVEKVQKEFGVDIFGFGSTVGRNMPALWKELAPGWEKTFRDLDVNVKASIDIKRSGLAAKPIKLGD